ncbi:MAG: hypothetical protein MJZ31_01595 [Bacteroidales bacterium]|nr:hypothetical protein [Bacteroidales bacterium]
MKRFLSFFSLLLIAAVQSWAIVPTIAQITIGEKTTDYYDVESFLDAYYAIEGTASVKLLGDITLPLNRNINNYNTASIISLDLNGHSIKANASHVGVIEVKGLLSVNGEGLIENDTDGGAAFGAYDGGVAEVNGGSYLCGAAICYCTVGSEVIINNGKFKVSSMYFDGFDKPFVNGGLFSIDPSFDCIHFYSVAIPNDDEETKAEYPYKMAGNQAVCNYLASLMGDDIYSGYGVKFFVNEGQLMVTIGENQPEPLASIMICFSNEGNDGYFCGMTGNDYVFYIENGELTRIGVKTGSEVSFYLDKRSTVPLAQITIGENVTDYYNAEEFRTDFASIEGTATVKLLGDITLPDEELLANKNSDADITLDLNGHNITGNCEDDAIIYVDVNKLTIVGDGIVENIGESGDAVGSGGPLVINEGTYIGVLDACFVQAPNELIINGGKFKAPYLYYRDLGKPIVFGGIFSMDPSDCVAEGYVVVDNDDEATKAEYPYKVVEKSLVPTAIERINADKAQKAVKTIENGKVVIIRGDKKYDLSGREL